MRWTPTAVTPTRNTWTVTAESTEGATARVQCESEAQARYFAAVCALGPAQLPRDWIVERLRAVETAASPTEKKALVD
jgi:hypothetical protein